MRRFLSLIAGGDYAERCLLHARLLHALRAALFERVMPALLSFLMKETLLITTIYHFHFQG